MAKEGNGKYGIIFGAVIFIMFIGWYQIELGTDLINSGDINTSISVPNCTDVNFLSCSVNYVGFFFGLTTLGSDFIILDVILLALGLTIGFMVVEVIRG